VDGHAAACSRIHRRRCRALCARSLFPFSFRSLFFSFPRLSCRFFSSSSLAFVRVRVPARGACSAHSAASAALTQPAALRDRSAATIARPLCDLVAPFSGRPLARPSSSSIDPLLVMFAQSSTPRVPPSMCLLGRCACDQQQPHQRRPASRLRFAQGPQASRVSVVCAETRGRPFVRLVRPAAAVAVVTQGEGGTRRCGAARCNVRCCVAALALR